MKTSHPNNCNNRNDRDYDSTSEAFVTNGTNDETSEVTRDTTSPHHDSESGEESTSTDPTNQQGNSSRAGEVSTTSEPQRQESRRQNQDHHRRIHWEPRGGQGRQLGGRGREQNGRWNNGGRGGRGRGRWTGNHQRRGRS